MPFDELGHFFQFCELYELYEQDSSPTLYYIIHYRKIKGVFDQFDIIPLK